MCFVDALLVLCCCFALHMMCFAARFAGFAVPVMLAVSIGKAVRTSFRFG